MKPYSLPDAAARRVRGGWAGAALLAAALLSACATDPIAKRDDLIAERAQARWDALLAGDFATAYAYLAPGYRSAKSAADFEISIKTRRVQYNAAEYRSHRCEGKVCTVSVWVGYTVPRPAQGVPEWKSNSMLEERWIEVGGEWWFSPDN
jgi:hypothetical protein